MAHEAHDNTDQPSCPALVPTISSSSPLSFSCSPIFLPSTFPAQPCSADTPSLNLSPSLAPAALRLDPLRFHDHSSQCALETPPLFAGLFLPPDCERLESSVNKYLINKGLERYRLTCRYNTISLQKDFVCMV